MAFVGQRDRSNMAFYDSASGASLWRGYDYFRDGNVSECCPISDHEFEGRVSGSEGAEYHVRIDIDHPRKSTCDCPFAKDRVVVCKHKVTLYFEALPSSADAFLRDMEERERLYEERTRKEAEAMRQRIAAYVNSLIAKEARAQLIEHLIVEEEGRYDERW